MTEPIYDSIKRNVFQVLIVISTYFIFFTYFIRTQSKDYENKKIIIFFLLFCFFIGLNFYKNRKFSFVHFLVPIETIIVCMMFFFSLFSSTQIWMDAFTAFLFVFGVPTYYFIFLYVIFQFILYTFIYLKYFIVRFQIYYNSI